MVYVKTFTVAVLSLAGSGTVAFGQQAYSTDANTVALYHLDETSGSSVIDASGNGRHAAYEYLDSGGNPLLISRGLASASPFLGTATSSGDSPASGGSRIFWTDTSAGNGSILLPAATNAFTVEAWVRLSDGVDGALQRIAAVQPTGVGAIDWSFEIIGSDNPFHAGSLSVSDSAVTNRAFIAGGLTWDTDAWYHLAFVYSEISASQANYSFYRTEAGETTASLLGTITTNKLVSHPSLADREFNLGNFYGDSGKQHLNGPFDEFRLSSVARTADDFANTLAVPEPATAGLLTLGIAAVLMRRRANRA